jgi:hypothetical protein
VGRHEGVNEWSKLLDDLTAAAGTAGRPDNHGSATVDTALAALLSARRRLGRWRLYRVQVKQAGRFRSWHNSGLPG